MKGTLKIHEIPKIVFLYTFYGILPYMPLRFKHALAEWIAAVTCWGEKATAMQSELQLLFGKDVLSEGEIKSIIRETLVNFRKDLFEIRTFPRLNEKNIDDLCFAEGLELLNKSLQRGRGVIIALCHFGSYKMILPYLGYKGYKAMQLAVNPLEFTSENESIITNKLMKIELESEKSLPVKFIYLGTNLRQIYAGLQNNEILVISVDGVMDYKRIDIPFFKRKIRLSPSILRIAQKTQSPILPAFTIRERNNKHRIVILDEIVPANGSVGMNEYEFLSKFGRLMEEYIKQYPSHYAWYLYRNKVHPPRIKSIITD